MLEDDKNYVRSIVDAFVDISTDLELLKRSAVSSDVTNENGKQDSAFNAQIEFRPGFDHQAVVHDELNKRSDEGEEDVDLIKQNKKCGNNGKDNGKELTDTDMQVMVQGSLQSNKSNKKKNYPSQLN